MINLGELFQQPVLASGGLFAPGQPPDHVLSPDGDARRSAYQVKRNPPLSATMVLGDDTTVSPEQPDGVGDGTHSHSNGFPNETPPPDAKYVDDTLPDDESELPPESEDAQAPPPPAPERAAGRPLPTPPGAPKRFVDEDGKSMYQNGLYWKLLSMHVHILLKRIIYQ